MDTKKAPSFEAALRCKKYLDWYVFRAGKPIQIRKDSNIFIPTTIFYKRGNKLNGTIIAKQIFLL
jgi:hypothetical protein